VRRIKVGLSAKFCASPDELGFRGGAACTCETVLMTDELGVLPACRRGAVGSPRRRPDRLEVLAPWLLKPPVGCERSCSDRPRPDKSQFPWPPRGTSLAEQVLEHLDLTFAVKGWISPRAGAPSPSQRRRFGLRLVFLACHP
jgi:hypothetical protein